MALLRSRTENNFKYDRACCAAALGRVPALHATLLTAEAAGYSCTPNTPMCWGECLHIQIPGSERSCTAPAGLSFQLENHMRSVMEPKPLDLH